MLERTRVCPLLCLPGFTKARFRRDWLHGADLGVAADFLGNVFEILMQVMDGRTMKDRANALWHYINAFYDANDVHDRLLGFSQTSFKQPKAQPKLRGGAAMIRALVPFAEEACTRLLDPTDLVHATVIEAAKWLHKCYACLKTDSQDWETMLPLASRMFVNCYVTLHDNSEQLRWKPKPKFHYFLELCSDGTKPNLIWTYRDEDFGGAWSAMARRRGGKRGPGAQSTMAIHNWRSSQPVPRIRAL